MMGLVTASGSPYRDGTFPSGTNWDDYILWCLVAMQEDCAREESLKATSKAAAKAATKETTKEGDKEQPSSVVQTQGTGTSTPAGAGVEEEKEEVAEHRATESMTTVPSGSFFKAGIAGF